MRRPHRCPAYFVLAFALGGCTTTPIAADPDADAGKETGPCIDSQCLGGLSCLSDVCVDAAAGTGGDEGPGDTTLPADDAPSDGDETDETGAPASTSTAGLDGTTSSTSAGESTDSGGDFIQPPDTGIPTVCSTYAQDCPVGQKCTVWASGVADVWDSTGCFDVVDEPAAVGEPCTLELGVGSGLDSCDVGSMCWIGAGNAGEAECVEFCGGDPDTPVCPETQSCVTSNEEVVAVCLSSCDPLAQTCPEGQGCYLGTNNFACAPDGSGGAAYGSACAFINACAPGYACLAEPVVGGCPPGGGCCTPFCDIEAPDTCPGEGQSCVSAYGDGEPILGLEHIGLCLLGG